MNLPQIPARMCPTCEFYDSDPKLEPCCECIAADRNRSSDQARYINWVPRGGALQQIPKGQDPAARAFRGQAR